MGVGASRRARTGARAGRALRIAAKYLDGTANAYYRAMLPLRELERRGHRVLWPALHDEDELLFGTPTFDVFVMHHFFRDEELELVRRLARHGVAVVWDKDDDISATPRRVPAYKSYGGRRGLKHSFARSVEIAASASLMTTPSAHLAARYRELGVEHVEVIENHVAPEDLAQARPRHQGVVIGITAAGEHAEDFKALRIDRVLRRLLRAHEGVRVVTIGWGHDLPASRHVHHPYVPIEKLVAMEREFDIGLAPLADTAFNRARSNVKLKEYAAAGAMWLASPVGPYIEMGESEGGVLVADDDWYATLERYVLDFRARARLAERARAWAQQQSADRAVQQWETAILRAVARKRAS
ncbi:MAG TPA: glycosyltransferase [Conexibacter sp.]|nr:glycosyltransferase [Conexibacter sp.]